MAGTRAVRRISDGLFHQDINIDYVMNPNATVDTLVNFFHNRVSRLRKATRVMSYDMVYMHAEKLSLGLVKPEHHDQFVEAITPEMRNAYERGLDADFTHLKNVLDAAEDPSHEWIQKKFLPASRDEILACVDRIHDSIHRKLESAMPYCSGETLDFYEGKYHKCEQQLRELKR